MQSHTKDQKYLENEHYKDIEGWAPGSSLEHGSISSFDGGGSMIHGVEDSVGSIAPLPAFADRDIVYNLKVNPSTYKASERSPARFTSYCCTIAGCNKVFSQSWHLWNHQYQQHGSEIRGSDFALTRRIKVHPHQLIDRKAGPKKNKMDIVDKNGGDVDGPVRSTIKDKKDANNAIYGKKNVSASASAIPGGLPPIAACVPVGYYVKQTHQAQGMAGHANPLSLTYAKKGHTDNDSGLKLNEAETKPRGYFDPRTIDPTMGHSSNKDEQSGTEIDTKTSGAVRDVLLKESKKKVNKSQFDDAVVQQARKWEESQLMGEFQLHTKKLHEWRRSIQVQLHRGPKAAQGQVE